MPRTAPHDRPPTPDRRGPLRQGRHRLPLPRSMAVAAVLMFALPAPAQRRGTTSQEKPLYVTFTHAGQFGKTVIPKGRYRLTLGKAGIALTHPTTMVSVGTLKAKETKSPAVAHATAAVTLKETTLTLTVKIRDRIYTTQGKISDDASPTESAAAEVEVETRTVGPGEKGKPKELTEDDLVREAIDRTYAPQVQHCHDKAKKRRWGADDELFWKCACPHTDRWRLPRVTQQKVVHYPVKKTKTGMSLTITKKGKVKECHVWAGSPPGTIPEATGGSRGR